MLDIVRHCSFAYKLNLFFVLAEKGRFVIKLQFHFSLLLQRKDTSGLKDSTLINLRIQCLTTKQNVHDGKNQGAPINCLVNRIFKSFEK